MRRLLQVDAYLTDIDGQHTRATQIIDISRMGVAFVSEQPVPTDVLFMFHFSFPGSSVRNELVLTVVHSSPIGSQGRYRNGARFLSISEECVERIVDYVTAGMVHGTDVA